MVEVSEGGDAPVRTVDPTEALTPALPEPVAGRHPDAVPGFILSMGWFLGSIGTTVLESLGVPSPGFALGLGLLASLIGYFLSRKAYRMSKEHPERYPRKGLAGAGRWLAAGPLLGLLAYLAVVIVFLLLFAAFL